MTVRQNLYELIFIVRQDMSPGRVEELTQKFSQILKDNGAVVTKTELCGLRPLAYPIQKNAKGHYVLLNVKGPVAAVAETERLMRLNEDILRFLFVKVDAHEAGPSAIMQGRMYRPASQQRPGEGSGRGGREGGRDGARDHRGGREGRDGGRYKEDESIENDDFLARDNEAVAE